MLYFIICNLLVNWWKRHPLDLSRPLIYWDVALLIDPSMLAGSNLGVILANILPVSAMMVLGK